MVTSSILLGLKFGVGVETVGKTFSCHSGLKEYLTFCSYPFQATLGD